MTRGLWLLVCAVVALASWRLGWLGASQARLDITWMLAGEADVVKAVGEAESEELDNAPHECIYCGAQYPEDRLVQRSWLLLSPHEDAKPELVLACCQGHLEAWLLYGRAE